MFPVHEVLFSLTPTTTKKTLSLTVRMKSKVHAYSDLDLQYIHLNHKYRKWCRLGPKQISSKEVRVLAQ